MEFKWWWIFTQISIEKFNFFHQFSIFLASRGLISYPMHLKILPMNSTISNCRPTKLLSLDNAIFTHIIADKQNIVKVPLFWPFSTKVSQNSTIGSPSFYFFKNFFSQVESEIQVESSLYFGSVTQVESSLHFGSVIQVESSVYFGSVTQVDSTLYLGV